MSVYLFRPTPSTITEWAKDWLCGFCQCPSGVCHRQPSFSSPVPMDPGDTVHLVRASEEGWCEVDLVVASSTVQTVLPPFAWYEDRPADSMDAWLITLAPVSLLEEPLTELPCRDQGFWHERNEAGEDAGPMCIYCIDPTGYFNTGRAAVPSLSPSEVQAWN